jgi:hypothetical protein
MLVGDTKELQTTVTLGEPSPSPVPCTPDRQKQIRRRQVLRIIKRGTRRTVDVLDLAVEMANGLEPCAGKRVFGPEWWKSCVHVAFLFCQQNAMQECPCYWHFDQELKTGRVHVRIQDVNAAYDLCDELSRIVGVEASVLGDEAHFDRWIFTCWRRPQEIQDAPVLLP